MAKRGNSKAGQSIKNFCKSATMVTVKKKKQVDSKPQEVRRKLENETATVIPSTISKSERSLAEWIKNRMQQDRKLLTTS